MPAGLAFRYFQRMILPVNKTYWRKYKYIGGVHHLFGENGLLSIK
jgi:hypothetical protein